jgi:uncharacterized protein (DUF58 family)
MWSIILFAAFVLWNFYMALLYDNIIYMTFVLMELFVLAFGIVQALLLKKGISIELRAMDEALDVNQSASFNLLVTNCSPVPFVHGAVQLNLVNVFTGKKEKIKKYFFVNGHAQKKLNFEVFSDKCGVVSIHAEKICVSDMTGLIHLRRDFHIHAEVVFLPEMIDMELDIEPALLNFHGDSDEYDKNRPGDDPLEVFGIRDYREGDRPSDVHWKATAKNDAIMVREHARALPCVLLLVADMRNKKSDVWKNADQYVTLLFSYSIMLIEKGCHHCVAWYDAASGSIVRQTIHNVQDVYGMMHSMMHSVPYEQEIDVQELYHCEFPYETYLTSYCFSMDLNLRKGGEVLWNGNDFLEA